MATVSETPLATLVASMFDTVVEGLQRRLPQAGFPDIRPAHCLSVLRVIDSRGTRPTDLARRAGVTPQAMAEFVRYLEAGGYVRRGSDPSDGRATIVKLTRRGDQARAAARKALAAIEADWTKRLGAPRMAQLRHMLSEITSVQDLSSG